jgi:hypothetical protein
MPHLGRGLTDMLRSLVHFGLVAVLIMLIAPPAVARSDTRWAPGGSDDQALNGTPDFAEVEIDGLPLFRVRGITAVPGRERAEAIRERIILLADDIPNSMVISSAIVNYTTLAKHPVHTEVGIGYDVSWRQVHAMLLMAADRTEGLKKQPEPFILQRSLDDFTVIYQLNAYCNDASRMAGLYSAMHANIQDVFNEYGVQIMSPNYESDPASPKLVPPDSWHVAPALPPAPDNGESVQAANR